MIRNSLQKLHRLPLTVRASFWFFVCAFVQKSVASISTPIFTRLMTTEEYGGFNVFNSWLSILTTVVSLHLYSGVFTQGLIKFDDRKAQYASSMQGLSLTLVVFWGIIYLIFHKSINPLLGLTTVQGISMLTIIWAEAAFQFWAVEQRVELRYRRLLPVTILLALSRPAFGIIAVMYADDKITARIISMAIIDVLICFWLFAAQEKRGKRFYSAGIWKYALGFNIPLIPHYLSMSVLSSSDRIMIERMVGESQAGIYSLAYQISLIMTMFNTALLQTVEPWLFKKIKKKETEDIAQIAYPLFVLIAGINLLLILLAPEIVAVFAPPAYQDAIWVIPPVALSVFFMFLYSFFSVFEFYYEKTGYVMLATTVSALMNIVLNSIFIREYGYLAAGYTTLFCYILYAVLHYLFMISICHKQLDNVRPYRVRILLGISIPFTAVGLLIQVMYRTYWLRYIIIAAAVAAAAVFRKKLAAYLKSILLLKKVDS